MKYTCLLLTLFLTTQLHAQDSLELTPITVVAPAWAAGPEARPVAALSREDLRVSYYG
jgi:hypothetical protein